MDKAKNETKWYGIVVGICILTAVAVAVMPWIGEVGAADPKTADSMGLWMNFFGKLHPLMLHLPIGATVLVLTMEGVGVISFGKYQPKTTLALAFAAGTSVIAVVFGYFLYLTGKFEGPLVEEHKRDGVIFTVLVIITFLVKYSHDVKKLSCLKLSYLLALFATGGVLISAGHHGGEMTHGDPLNALPSKILDKRAEDASKLSARREAEGNVDGVIDPVIYADIVHTILDNKCISCHGPDKDKGSLRMDSLEAMFDGGDEEECLVAGDVEGSFMITSIMLPKDDDYHMPPESKPQITAEELKVLKWWIEMGAPEKTKLSEVEVSDDILAAIASLKTPEEVVEEKKKRKLAEAEEEKEGE
ncbi:MAG: c-type cytochrome domain-containing protein [Akkermansiaceae bacterium]